MLHPLSESWSIDLPDDGSGEPDADGNLVVSCELGTIVVSLFAADDAFDPESALQDLKAGERPAPRAEFDEYGPDGTIRWAFLVDDDGDLGEGPTSGEAGMGLFGYVIDECGWVQVGVLFGDRHDHSRALGIWRSVRRTTTTSERASSTP